MFFTAIHQMMTENVDLTIVIRKANGQLTVATLPKSNGLKDEAQNHIVPLTVTGTPQELDAGFLQTVTRPIQKAGGLIANMAQFEAQADKAAANSKAAREAKSKESKEEREKREKYEKLMKKAEEKGVKLLLPVDTVAAKEFAADAEPVVVDAMHIPADMMGMDIGPKTIERFCAATRGAGTIVWNGPMGVFEFPAFANGTKAMAKALAESGAVTIIGGGDSAAAAEQLGFADKITHISTGGGASLEFLEGKELPGVACLLDK